MWSIVTATKKHKYTIKHLEVTHYKVINNREITKLIALSHPKSRPVVNSFMMLEGLTLKSNSPVDKIKDSLCLGFNILYYKYILQDVNVKYFESFYIISERD